MTHPTRKEVQAFMRVEVQAFMRLFRGRTDAYGLGEGLWVKHPLHEWQYQDHLEGKKSGLGVAPLMDDGRIWFAAIDLDEPDFEAAEELSAFLSFDGTAFIERSRSGNAHIWVFFAEPIEAWVVRGVMKEAIAAIEKPAIEIFPKQDKLMPGMLGNYINLPYHGDKRPILFEGQAQSRSYFLHLFQIGIPGYLNNPDAWRKRADWLLISPPSEHTESAEFGTGRELHMCAEWIIANRDENPIREGHRNAVFFALSKMLCHYEGVDELEGWEWLKLVRDSADEKGVDHVPDRELKRIFNNAKRGEFTSTGCDDPLVQPYAHPDCPIAKAG